MPGIIANPALSRGPHRGRPFRSQLATNVAPRVYDTTFRQAILGYGATFLFPLPEMFGDIASLVGGHIGTQNGVPAYGVIDLAVGDDGGIGYGTAGTDFHSVVNHADFSLGASFTVGCLFRRTVDAGVEQFFFNHGNTGYGLGISGADQLELTRVGAALLVRETGTSPVETNVHMVLATSAGANTHKLYKDGVDVSAAVHATAVADDTTAALIIGREVTAAGAGSDISHVFGIKRVLTANDAANLWDLARQIFPSDFVFQADEPTDQIAAA